MLFYQSPHHFISSRLFSAQKLLNNDPNARVHCTLPGGLPPRRTGRANGKVASNFLGGVGGWLLPLHDRKQLAGLLDPAGLLQERLCRPGFGLLPQHASRAANHKPNYGGEFA